MPIDRIKFIRVAPPDKPRETVVVEGRAEPGTVVEGENLSAAPFGPSRETSTFSKATADRRGNFSLFLEGGVEGDFVRLKGQGGSPLTVRIAGVANADGRRPEVSQQSLRLVPTGKGELSVQNVSQNPRVGEPGVKLGFQNARTHENKSVVLGDDGRLPDPLVLPGEPGDIIEIYATDGHHDVDLRDRWAVLCVPGKGEPILTEGVDRTIEADGPLFINGPSYTDPLQGGSIGDCYLVAAASSIAELLPQVLEDRIRETDDGKVAVTLDRWDAPTKSYVSETIEVSRELALGRGSLAYGTCSNDQDPGQMETWWPFLEKAYAVWKGGYPAIGSGYPYEIFEALLGREGRHIDPGVVDPAACRKVIDQALIDKSPMVAWTWPDSMDQAFVGTGLVADHAYSVHGTKEEAGEIFVKLRNPWGSKEPGKRQGGDGVDDGIFWLPLAQFQKKFCGLGIASD